MIWRLKETDAEYMKGRLTSRLINLKVVDIEMQKSKELITA
ncbi:hypothetical protein OFP88_14550 [Brachyspira hyodysenteriae]|nr:hypothetical protein [Brachyspira hyodysenteriae]MCZ9877252.1 hypothetical protein [Brachyspira hyodysenteriae]MCZ9945952.1 hypothetical protein [Brachyspira hyodysenteriae]MCZ9945981.1 hypothetical protein [Brachyspira hyodysenteriae]MCZ9967367.1 hypothetical protein [Brachyspira hyodysenteriae]MCZ9992967.1 hypothetical protein [Brachyspira hyodysenteriae]